MSAKIFFQHFLRGLLFVVPVSATLFIIFETIAWVDGLLKIQIPGVGLITVLLATTIIGYLANSIIAKPLFDMLGNTLRRIPVVNFIYSSLNDVVGAVAGEKKKFNRPVLVPFDDHGKLMKPGFVTQEDLSENNLDAYIAVYLPHSYNFSGNLFFIEKSRVVPIDGSNSQFMKYIVSGGLTGRLGKKEAQARH